MAHLPIDKAILLLCDWPQEAMLCQACRNFIYLDKMTLLAKNWISSHTANFRVHLCTANAPSSVKICRTAHRYSDVIVPLECHLCLVAKALPTTTSSLPLPLSSASNSSGVCTAAQSSFLSFHQALCGVWPLPPSASIILCAAHVQHLLPRRRALVCR